MFGLFAPLFFLPIWAMLRQAGGVLMQAGEEWEEVLCRVCAVVKVVSSGLAECWFAGVGLAELTLEGRPEPTPDS